MSPHFCQIQSSRKIRSPAPGAPLPSTISLVLYLTCSIFTHGSQPMTLTTLYIHHASVLTNFASPHTSCSSSCPSLSSLLFPKEPSFPFRKILSSKHNLLTSCSSRHWKSAYPSAFPPSRAFALHSVRSNVPPPSPQTHISSLSSFLSLSPFPRESFFALNQVLSCLPALYLSPKSASSSRTTMQSKL